MTAEQVALMDYMGELSEEYYSAGWLSGLEYVLWEVLEGKPGAFAGGTLKADEIQRLYELKEKCGGWIYWNDKPNESNRFGGEEFIELEAWKEKYKQHELAMVGRRQVQQP